MDELPRVKLNKDDSYALERRGFIFKNVFIGSGGFGEVYKGTHFDEDVAIKSMYMDPDESEPEEILDMIKEIFILKKLSRHESIVKLLGFYFVSSSHILIFMELLNGKSLRDQLREIQPNVVCGQLAHKLFCEIGSGLLYMHDSGIAHCDLKPPNILLKIKYDTRDFPFSAKISDFGLSKACYDVQTGEPCMMFGYAGTPLYMSPQALQSYVKYKEKGSTFFDFVMKFLYFVNGKSMRITYCPFRADVFSLGLILYEMLHGNKTYPNQVEKKFPNINYVTGSQMLDTWIESKGIVIFDEKYRSYQKLVKLVIEMVKCNPKDRITMEEVMKNSWVTNPCVMIN